MREEPIEEKSKIKLGTIGSKKGKKGKKGGANKPAAKMAVDRANMDDVLLFKICNK